ncbi:hypothetical protein KFE25_014410 [Diacronema lutheri]|uniref:Uncharacterized protein n=1 Tax=Diacronema lutheri TaxID=2081491 RepID=A0A8J6C2J1_DIALT|nr:hypothetical protein KFE25_014410 [Diacronema lutheri]
MAVDLVDAVDSPHLPGPPPEKVAYGDRVALALAKDAALNALDRAERWRQRCALAERELGAVSDATDSALDRLEVPAHAATVLLDQLAAALAALPADGALGAPREPAGYVERRLATALERERAARASAEAALHAERRSHAKTRERLALAEAAGIARSGGSAAARSDSLLGPVRASSARDRRAELAEPDRRRLLAVALAASERARLRRALHALGEERQQRLGELEAAHARSHAVAARAFRAWDRARLSARIRAHALASGRLLAAQGAVATWRRRAGHHQARNECASAE